jgi:hypothetical protein
VTMDSMKDGSYPHNGHMTFVERDRTDKVRSSYLNGDRSLISVLGRSLQAHPHVLKSITSTLFLRQDGALSQSEGAIIISSFEGHPKRAQNILHFDGCSWVPRNICAVVAIATRVTQFCRREGCTALRIGHCSLQADSEMDGRSKSS